MQYLILLSWSLMKRVDFNSKMSILPMIFRPSAPFPGCTGGKLLLLLYGPGSLYIYHCRDVWSLCSSYIPGCTGGKLLPLLYGPGLLSLAVFCGLSLLVGGPFWPGSFCQCFSVLAQSVAQLASCGSGCTGEISRPVTNCAGVSQLGLLCHWFGLGLFISIEVINTRMC